MGEYSAATSKFYDEYQKKTLCIAFYTVDWSFDHRDGKFGFPIKSELARG